MAKKLAKKSSSNEAKRNAAVVKKIINRYGPVIDLQRDPDMLIDMFRRYSFEVVMDDNPCGGTPQPPPSPGPSGGKLIEMEDILRAVLQISRKLDRLQKRI